MQRWPVIGPIVFGQNVLVYISWGCVVAIWLYLSRTRPGLNVRAVGESPAAADTMGINVTRYRYVHTLVGGAFAGVAGATITLAITPQWVDGITGGAGWIAIALVIFAFWRPELCLVGAYFFGALQALAPQLQARHISLGPTVLWTNALPYVMTIVVLVIVSSGTARSRLGAPAALGKAVRAGGALMAAAPPAVSMRGITKRFPGVVANDGVDFEAAAGEVHALLGENGAGKSTLSHILTGLYRADEGTISLYGEQVDFASPREAIDAGVGMVHQHFRLVQRFSVAENLVLGDRRGVGRTFRIDPGAVETQVRELGERYSLDVDPHAKIWQLSVGEQQRVEILKALYQEARVLILDEPTAVLTPDEADNLFVTARQMASEGRTVIFISHKLHEVKAVSDRVTVLRAGKALATVQTADATPQSLAALMVGRDIEIVSREGHARPDSPPVLELADVWADGDRGNVAVKGVSLTVRAGEIAAVAGVSGNGQRELAEAIAGLRPCTKGTVSVKGKQCTTATRGRRSRPGSATCPRTASEPASRRRSRSRRTSG